MGRLHRDFLGAIAAFLEGHPDNVPSLVALEGCCAGWRRFMAGRWEAACGSTFGQAVNFQDVAAAYFKTFPGHSNEPTFIITETAKTAAADSTAQNNNSKATAKIAAKAEAAGSTALPTAAPLRPVPAAAMAVAASSSNFKSNSSSRCDAGEGVRKASSAPLAGAAFWKGLTLRLFRSFALVTLTSWEDPAAPVTFSSPAAAPALSVSILLRRDATAAEAKRTVQRVVGRPAHQFDVAVERSVKTMVEVGSPTLQTTASGSHVLSLAKPRITSAPKLEVLNDMSVPQHIFRHGEALRVFGWEQFSSMPQLEVADLITMAPISEEELREDEAWWEIYEASFPDSERESREQILLEAGSGGRCYAVRLNGSTVGITVIHFLREVRCAFLVYVAVSQHLRSLSLGSKLLKFVFADCERYYASIGEPSLGVVLELEVLDEGESEEDNATRLRRTRFYERLGAVLFTGPYSQPPVNGPPVPLSLMFRPNPGVELPSPSDMRRLMRCMFVEKYVATTGVPFEAVQPMIEKFCQEPGTGEWVPAH